MILRPGFFLGLILFALLTETRAADRPNIIWISCEDINAHYGCYGDPHAKTPRLDTLAKQGVRYTHAFTAAGVCAPCRSTIITGMYQNSIGTHHMRCKAKLPDWLDPFPIHLRKAGYYCTNNSKTDYQFGSPGSKEIWNESSSKAHWKNRKDSDQPFFAVFNFGGCHESGIASEGKYKGVTAKLPDEHRQDPTKLTTLPPYYPDNAVTREDWKRNYELISAMDAWAGQLIDELEEAGLAEDTIIMHWSDHGVGLPRAKRWLYDSGTRVPLIIRIPEKWRTKDQGKPGTVEGRLVNSTDFGPTVLSLAGVDLPDNLQGLPFLGKAAAAPRSYVYGARDRMDERYDIIRTVRDSRYRYIRNFEPLKPYYQYMNTPEKGATMKEIRKAEEAGNLEGAVALFSQGFKPVEELYDSENDPHEINNLARDPAHREKTKELREALWKWQAEIGDIGLVPESEIERREKDLDATYDLLREGARPDLLEDLVGAANLIAEGEKNRGLLNDLLGKEEPLLRYWGARGLGNLQGESEASKKAVAQQLAEEKIPAVRIVLARALAAMGDAEAALPVLKEELQGDLQWGRLEAAIVLDEMDEAARPAIPALKAALKKQPNKYIIRVANRALNELEGTNNSVP